MLPEYPSYFETLQNHGKNSAKKEEEWPPKSGSFRLTLPDLLPSEDGVVCGAREYQKYFSAGGGRVALAIHCVDYSHYAPDHDHVRQKASLKDLPQAETIGVRCHKEDIGVQKATVAVIF
jgi:hypothetical protein